VKRIRRTALEPITNKRMDNMQPQQHNEIMQRARQLGLV
jgi:hypothetical protein